MRLKVSHSLRASAASMPVMRSLIMSAEACDTAHPMPCQAASSMTPSSLILSDSVRSSPQEGFTPSCTQVASSISYL